MGLQEILEYQSIDGKIYREEMALRKSEQAQKAVQVQHSIGDVKNALLKLNSETAEIFAEIERLSARLKAIVDEDRTDFSFNSVNTISQVENLEKALSEYSEEIAKLEKNLAKDFKRLSEISNQANLLSKQGTALSQENKKLRSYLDEERNKIYAKYESEIKKLNELKSQIDPKFIERYLLLRKEKKMPAFVKYENGNCSACGMHVEAELKGKIKDSGDMAECPNCRRIIYKP